MYVTDAVHEDGEPLHDVPLIVPKLPCEGPDAMANVSPSPSGSVPARVSAFAASSFVELLSAVALGVVFMAIETVAGSEVPSTMSFTVKVKLADP